MPDAPNPTALPAGLGEVLTDNGPIKVAPLASKLPTEAWAGGDKGSTVRRLLAEVNDPDTAESTETALEKIIGRSNLIDMYRLRSAVKLADAVGLIMRADYGAGTGFLIAEDRIMTNHHVLETDADAKGAWFLLDYELGFDGDPRAYVRFRLAPKRYFHANKDLDYAIVAVDREVVPIADGDSAEVAAHKRHEAGRSVISLAAADLGTAQVDADAFIIQHPLGGYKQVAAADNEIRYVGNKYIQYITDTQPGSSGSPVFDEWFRLIALHHQGGDLHEPGTNRSYYRNQGVNIRRIVEDMPTDFRTDMS